MPASLTIQVRLGFSMGWRIWTPNEVGFYAKTLAHSYFILVILKAKFLKEKIWIVNYNLFLGKRKYYIFIEFLKFGMKTKEERSFWRKMIYISVVTRSNKFKKNVFIPRRNRHFRVKLLRKSIQASFPKRDWRRKWKKVNITIYKKVLPMIKKQHILNLKNTLSEVNKKPYNEEFINTRKINIIKKINKYKIFIYNFKLNKKKA